MTSNQAPGPGPSPGPQDLFDVRDRVCLVTGASSGLGAAFARVLVDNGASVVGISLDAPQLGTGGGDLVHLRGDVRSDDDIAEAIALATDRFGRLDVLVNNAGSFGVVKASRQGRDEIADMLAVNVTASAEVCRRAHAVMRRNPHGGSIINVTSVLARLPIKGLSAYGAGKAALEQLTRTLALEWAAEAVRVNAIAPGWYRTAMTREYLDRGLAGILTGQIPMGRLGEGGDLAGPLLLLASDASRYMTGTTITVDGGYSVRT